jgi:hypothetical protein
MPYVVLSDFRRGLDRRRSLLSSAPGSAWRLDNAHITRGGDILQRRAVVPRGGSLLGSFGLIRSGAGLVVQGTGFTLPPDFPAGVTYQATNHSGGHAVTRVVASTQFRGQAFSLVEFANGDVQPFYNGVMVTSLNSRLAGVKPVACITQAGKVFVAAGSIVYFSALNDALEWNNDAVAGSGFVDMSNFNSGTVQLTGLGIYQDTMAIFSNDTIQIWKFDPDPDISQQLQVLYGIGAVAAEAIVNYGDTDLFFLSQSGVRSLRARDSSNLASVFDLGTPIDDDVAAAIETLTPAELAVARMMIEPIDGRLWLVLGGSLFVYTSFPSANIAAWSNYLIPGVVQAIVSVGRRIYLRVDNRLCDYGGVDGKQYDASTVEVILPYLDASKPAHAKSWTGLDVACQGSWKIEAGFDPADLARKELVATLTGPTHSLGRVPATGESTHAYIRATTQGVGPHRLESICWHFKQGVAD